MSSFQNCKNLRTEVFHRLLSKHKTLKSNYGFLQKESKAQLAACKAELEKETAEVSRLKKELERANTRNSELTSYLGIEHTARQKHAKEYEYKLAELASRGTTAEKELATLQAKCDAWLAELVMITKELGRKYSFAFISFSFLSDIPFVLVNNLT